MARAPFRSARELAANFLARFDPRREFAAPVLHRRLDQTKERQRTTDLVFGVIRNQVAIDTILAEFADCPAERVTPELVGIIRVALYELIYNPKTDQYAIVNEAAKNARFVGGNKQVGFVNAVLRQVARCIVDRQAGCSVANPRRTLMQTPETGCEFCRDFLPDPMSAQADYLSICFSLPKWLIEDWIAEFGFDGARLICLACNRRPSLYIRPNTLKTTVQNLLTSLHRESVAADLVPGTSSIKISTVRSIAELPGYDEGMFIVQDITASGSVALLQPKPGWKVLDMCAAPGTKTVQLAEAVGESGLVVATDINAERLKRVGENIRRLGLHNIHLLAYSDVNRAVAESGPFDAILLDVPCSNTGVLARRRQLPG